MTLIRSLILCALCTASLLQAGNSGPAAPVLMLQVQPQSIVLSSPVHALILQSFQRIGDDIHVLQPEADGNGRLQLSKADRQAIQQADLVVWNGPAYEPYLQSALQNHPRTLEVMALPALQHWQQRPWWQDHWLALQAWFFLADGQPQELPWLDADNAVKLAKAMAEALHYPDHSTRSFDLRFQLWKHSHQQASRHARKTAFLLYRDSYRYLLSPFGLAYEVMADAGSQPEADQEKVRAWLARQPEPVLVCLVLPYDLQGAWADSFAEQSGLGFVWVDEALESGDYTHFFDFWLAHYRQLSACVDKAALE